MRSWRAVDHCGRYTYREIRWNFVARESLHNGELARWQPMPKPWRVVANRDNGGQVRDRLQVPAVVPTMVRWEITLAMGVLEERHHSCAPLWRAQVSFALSMRPRNVRMNVVATQRVAIMTG